MDNEDIFAVEETSASQPATPEAPAQAAEPSAPIETDLTPNAEQQAVLDRIRDASKNTGTFQLQNGRVVVAKSERTPEPQQQVQPPQTQQPPVTPAQQSEQMVELNWRGQIVQKPISEVRNLAQKGFDYEAKNFEINQQRQALAQREMELNQMMQTVQNVVPQQTQQQEPTAPADDSVIISNAMKAVKDRFGKDDPDFEIDTLNPEQMAVYNMAVYRETAKADAMAQQQAAEQQREQARQIRLNSWEQQQRDSDPQYNETVQWALANIGTDATGRPVTRLHQILNGVQVRAFEQALQTGDTETLSKVVNYCKVKYQQQKLGLPTKPQTVAVPVVQAPGNGQQPQQQSAAAKTWPKSEHNIPQEQRIELWKARFAKR